MKNQSIGSLFQREKAVVGDSSSKHKGSSHMTGARNIILISWIGAHQDQSRDEQEKKPFPRKESRLRESIVSDYVSIDDVSWRHILFAESIQSIQSI
jgi:hypothetical protein